MSPTRTQVSVKIPFITILTHFYYYQQCDSIYQDLCPLATFINISPTHKCQWRHLFIPTFLDYCYYQQWDIICRDLCPLIGPTINMTPTHKCLWRHLFIPTFIKYSGPS